MICILKTYKAIYGKQGKRVTKADCLCYCGKEFTTDLPKIKGGNTTSCGCRKKTMLAAFNKATKTTHGLSRHPLCPTHKNMMNRCYDPKHKDYPNYGGRGIIVCDRWHDIRNFIADTPPSPFEGAQRDRRDNDGNYVPENMRWVTNKENCRNKVNTLMLTVCGDTMPLIYWCEVFKVSYDSIKGYRLSRKCSVEDAFEHYLRKKYAKTELTACFDK